MTHGFRTVVVDPPWPQQGAGPQPLGGVGEGFNGLKGQSAPMPYKTMSLTAISELDIGSLADPSGAHLYLWTTNGFLFDARRILDAWGFRYSTTLVWAKNPMGHGMGGCYGISTEYILFARKGTLSAESRVGRTWFNWKRPYDSRGKPMHSAKPHAFYDMVETVSPGPRIDVFARRERPGWETWGDQAPNALAVAL